MPLPLPDLDDRRWADLLAEARALLPRLAPVWTDQNYSDPGITLLELLAYVAEADLYRANRVGDAHRRAFLALLGVVPAPARPAQVVLALSGGPAGPGGPAQPWLPAGVVLEAAAGGTAAGTGAGGSGGSAGSAGPGGAGAAAPVRVVTTAGVRLLGAALRAGQVATPGAAGAISYADVTDDIRQGRPVAALGVDPGAGAALLLGFDAATPLPPGARLSLWLALDDAATAGLGELPAAAGHHGAGTVWERFDGAGWAAWPAGAVTDDTRALTRSAPVTLPFDPAAADPAAAGPAVAAVGAVAAALRWVRCRLAAGRPDAAPRLCGVAVDAVPSRQAVPAVDTIELAPGAGPLPPPAAIGVPGRYDVRVDAAGRLTRLAPLPPDAPAGTGVPLTVLDLPRPGAAVPAVSSTLVRLGTADGLPAWSCPLPTGPVDAPSVRVWVAAAVAGAPPGTDPADPVEWAVVADLAASGPADRHVRLDPAGGGTSSGTGGAGSGGLSGPAALAGLAFGDGVHGRCPAAGDVVLGSYATTVGAAGTLPTGRALALAAGNPLTRAACAPGPVPTAAAVVAGGTPGADAEDLDHAAGRAADAVWQHERLLQIVPAGTDGTGGTLDQVPPAVVLGRSRPARVVTAVDAERVAREVPGTTVRRARALAGLDPELPGLAAPGTLTVVVVPELPAGRPEPTPGLLAVVRDYLCPRLALGTRLVVAGPGYVEVTCTVRVRARRGADPARLRAGVAGRLAGYLDPLAGGPAGLGWPFGRPVDRAELLGVVDGVAGVDRVEALDVSAGCGDVGCGNVALGPLDLVTSGPHRVEVVAAAVGR